MKIQIVRGLWSCDSYRWNYNYQCNQCLSPLMLWVRFSIRVRCTILLINFVSDLWQVGGFLQVLRFPPPINTDRNHNYNWNIVESGIKHHQTNKQINKLLSLKAISTFELKPNLEPPIFSGPPWTSKCLQPALALTYRGWSPCKPLTKLAANTPVRYGSSP